MKIPDNAQYREFSIGGVVLRVPEPYQEGHKLDANQSAAMSMMFREMLRRDIGERLNALRKSGAGSATLQAELDAFIGDYEPGRTPGLYQINAAALTLEERRFIEGALRRTEPLRQADVEKKVEQVIETARAGKARVWRLEARDAHCIVVTQLIDWSNGRELLIWLIGGHGFFKYGDLVCDRLKSYAIDGNCHWVRTVARKGLAEYLINRLGFRATLTTVVATLKSE